MFLALKITITRDTVNRQLRKQLSRSPFKPDLNKRKEVWTKLVRFRIDFRN